MAAQPVAPPAPAHYVGAVPVSRIFLLISGICFVIASVCAAAVFHGPVLAWALGGVAAYVLAWAIG